jgi:Raf kinase inhibitor-like YbhB/YbcL family protein
MAFHLFSNAFPEGGSIPPLHTCKGADVSPSLEWSGEPSGTRSFVLIVDDPDAPAGTWDHWLLYDIPAKAHTLPQGAHSPGIAGTNSFGKAHYGGPCPPPGPPHRYYFKLYALDKDSLGLPAGASRAEVERAIKGHVLAQAQYMGRFGR